MSTDTENIQKSNLSLVPPTSGPNANLPAYLQKRMQESQVSQISPVGLDGLKKYWEPARVKIVQAQSGERFKAYPIGTVILVPEMTVISGPKQPYWITPVFCYTEFCVWNPYGLKGQLQVIRERSFDPDSGIGRKAAYKKNKKESDYLAHCPDLPNNLKSKKDDPNYMLKYCEHINWLCVLRFNANQPEHPANRLVNTPILFSFHHSGYFEGKQLSNLIVNRKIDLFAGQYELFSEDKTNSKGTWKGFTINNPSLDSGMSSVVEDEQDFLNYEGLYNGIQKQFDAGEIYSGDYEEDVSDDAPVDDSKGKF